MICVRMQWDKWKSKEEKKKLDESGINNNKETRELHQQHPNIKKNGNTHTHTIEERSNSSTHKNVKIHLRRNSFWIFLKHLTNLSQLQVKTSEIETESERERGRLPT